MMYEDLARIVAMVQVADPRTTGVRKASGR